MSISESDLIRTAVLGYGTSGRIFHTPFIHADPDFTLSLVVTGNADRASQVRETYPATEVVATTAEVFDRAGELDLVVIGTPPATHADLARQALEAGLDVIVDKPFTVTSEEGRELVALAQRLGRRLTVFQNRRWDGDFLSLRHALESGELRDVSRFESRFEVYTPQPRVSWKSETTTEAGGGVLYDLGAHLIDQAITLHGPLDPDREPYAELETRRAGAVAPDDAFVALHHASGVTSHLWMSTLCAQPGPRLRALSPTGGFVTYGLDPQEPQLKSGMRPGDPGFGVSDGEAHVGTVDAPGVTPIESGDYAGFYRAIAEWLLRGADAPVDPSASVNVIEIIERLQSH
ncbi:Gfo/Idh/MocA family oxidoreductase [Galactobacter sp.]|uniref:Gfo/Idh/MocA family oxidoreductase n=1 Tax=Galactobacter sp. TaxID=2676125 RepID=UPI0025B9AF7C|nr:Gfo/Idh/MocA family oxidoreductase [Galactobacter sp.]